MSREQTLEGDGHVLSGLRFDRAHVGLREVDLHLETSRFIYLFCKCSFFANVVSFWENQRRLSGSGVFSLLRM